MAKLNPGCDVFLQRPSRNYHGRDTWFDCVPLGIHTINNIMKKISKQSGSSKIYTNHCVKASTATILKRAGVPMQDIMHVTGHKNAASISSYAAGPTDDDRANMSNILARYGEDKDNNKENDNNEVNIVSEGNEVAIQNHSMQRISSSIFAGANFHGPVTFNIQLNN